LNRELVAVERVKKPGVVLCDELAGAGISPEFVVAVRKMISTFGGGDETETD
jgi:Na+-translocating ferredoxin:NAD+ oxidoreductase RnfG subunit